MMVHALDRSCPLCASRASDPYFVSQDGYDYRRCRECTLVYVRDPIPMPRWNAHYGERPEVRALEERRFAAHSAGAASSVDHARFEFYLRRLRGVVGDLDGKRYLDVGTFYGDALEVARLHGLRGRGLEGKERVARCARELGRDVVFGTSEDLASLDLGAPFDIVSAYEILEHATDPARSLRSIEGLLAPGGSVIATVPNLANFEIQTLREYCFHLLGGVAITGHVNLFDRATLARLLADCGFEVVDVFTQYGSNLLNVHLHQTGRYDRIYCYDSIVAGRETGAPLDRAVVEAIGTVAPAFHRWEQEQALGPILGMVARKRG